MILTQYSSCTTSLITLYTGPADDDNNNHASDIITGCSERIETEEEISPDDEEISPNDEELTGLYYLVSFVSMFRK